VTVMGEAGVDISHHVSERVDPYLNHHFDYVVTVCDRAQETCPVFQERLPCCIGALRTRRKRREPMNRN
jgi:protein-tyrosine-phosphatase